jgi:hypothetical protein
LRTKSIRAREIENFECDKHADNMTDQLNDRFKYAFNRKIIALPFQLDMLLSPYGKANLSHMFTRFDIVTGTVWRTGKAEIWLPALRSSESRRN